MSRGTTYEIFLPIQVHAYRARWSSDSDLSHVFCIYHLSFVNNLSIVLTQFHQPAAPRTHADVDMWGRVLACRAKAVSTVVRLPARDGVQLELSHGRLARLAPGSAVLHVGDALTLLATVTRGTERNVGSLMVDYRAKAAGKGVIPATFLRREMQPAQEETLTARAVDRALRPTLQVPSDHSLHVCISQLCGKRDSSDTSVDALAVNAASAALLVADAALPAPVAAARASMVNGDIHIFPSDKLVAIAQASVLVAVADNRIVSCSLTTRKGGISNSDAARLLQAARDATGAFVTAQRELAHKVSQLRTEEGYTAFPRQMPRPPQVAQELQGSGETGGECEEKAVYEKAYAVYCDAFVECRRYPGKAHRASVVSNAQQSVLDAFPETEMQDVLLISKTAARNAFRDVLVRDGVRIDGRKFDEVREIRCERSFLNGDVHGSALFERGDTQVLANATIGLRSMAKKSEDHIGYVGEKKRFFVHYSFPPFATGEAGRFAGHLNRREIGHSALAEHALEGMIKLGDEKLADDGMEEYPYVIRLTADVIASDGSSSMATVCAGTLALMDAGVPLTDAVAGVAMGVVTTDDVRCNDDDYIILTDLLGAEDHFGNMDMKVTGTAKTITAIQMDVKGNGLPVNVIEKVLDRAEQARQSILDEMHKAAQGVRQSGDMPLHAPRSEVMSVDASIFARILLRKSASGLRDIEEEAAVRLTFDARKEIVRIDAPDAQSAETAKSLIAQKLANLDVGTKITMRVKDLRNAFAIVECEHQTIEGLLHVSKMQTSASVQGKQKFPDARNILTKGDLLDCVVLESDRAKGVLRFALAAPPPSMKNEKSVAQTVDEFLSAVS